MTLEAVVGVVGGVATITSGIFGGGMFRAYIKSREDVAIARHIMKDTQERLDKIVNDVRNLEFKSVEVSTQMKQVEENMKKLDLLPDLKERIASLEALIGSVADMVKSLAHRE